MNPKPKQVLKTQSMLVLKYKIFLEIFSENFLSSNCATSNFR